MAEVAFPHTDRSAQELFNSFETSDHRCNLNVSFKFYRFRTYLEPIKYFSVTNAFPSNVLTG